MKFTASNFIRKHHLERSMYSYDELCRILNLYATSEDKILPYETFLEAIEEVYGTISHASKKLKISRTTLHQMINNPGRIRLKHLYMMSRDGMQICKLIHLKDIKR